jgi:calcineurin-like phosphoesterase family protein
MTEEKVTGSPSSRDSHAGAGWHCRQEGTYAGLVPQGALPLSWLSPGPLWKARNDRLASWFGDPPNDDRRAWVAAQRAAGVDPNFTIHDYADHSSIAFLLLGDAGEGDASQYAVVPPLLQQSAGTNFMIIMGDVVYPAGDASDYEDKFYRPYSNYERPIYGVPGNHDWYDDLHGFMRHFCDNHGVPNTRKESGWSGVFRRLLWRAPQKTDETAVARMQRLRARPEQRARQPGPYMAIDAGPLLIVTIDTGISGGIDHDQGEWLRRISSMTSKPKILVTGKPLYVDGVRHPGVIENSDSTVDDIVRVPEHNYLAAIGGDVHNYQRYPVEIEGGRTIQYIVNGGGGAGTQGTHKIPRITLPGVNESDFRCYPRRADSLSIFSQMYERRFGRFLGKLFIPPDQAAGLLEEKLGITPIRREDRNVAVSVEARRAFSIVAPRKERLPGPLHEYFVQFMDYNHPPMFKSFLRIDASKDEVLIRSFAATGCREQETDVPLEDAVRALRGPTGSWQWVTEVP